MNKLLKQFVKSKILKGSLLVLFFSALIMLTACSGDEDDQLTGQTGYESSSDLMASIADGESTIGEITDETEFGTGYKDSVGTDNYDPDNPFKMSRHARPIRRILKQDVYGNVLTDDFYFYRNTLSKNEQRLYDQIYANAVELDPDFELTTKIPVNRLRDIFDSVRLDNPDLFWVTTGYSYSYDDNDNVTSMTLDFYDMVNNLDDYKKTFYNCTDSVLEYAMHLDNDVDKVKYIHDLLTNVNDYEFGPLDQSAYSAVVVGKTVCAGYADAFQYYMQRLGIPSAVLFGYAGENHAWSMVKLDGDFYEMDVTWDDPIGNPPNTYYYDYFNITTSEIAPTRNRQEKCEKLPKAKGTVYSFPNWYGSDPGRDFSSIKYGSPKTSLPHIYPEFDSQKTEQIDRVDEKKDIVPEEVPDEIQDEGNYDLMDPEEMGDMMIEWSDEEWETLWFDLSEFLSEEELEEIWEMEWEDFVNEIYGIYYGN